MGCHNNITNTIINFDETFLSGYVEEIYQTFLTATNEQLENAAEKLKEMTPLPMNTMLEKESKAYALQKRVARSKKVKEDVPPTTPGMKVTFTLTNPLIV